MNATVVKVGGSLALYPEKLRTLCAKLSQISKKYGLIVVPGGGEFADVVRSLDERFSLPPEVSHRMAILGMDQYGFLLSNLTPNSVAVKNLEEVKDIIDSGGLPVFLPSNLLLNEDPLENSWDVTSDSIAVYLAGRLHVHRVLLVTDVDGIYSGDPKKNIKAKLINNLSVQKLLAMKKRSSVDVFLPKLLLKNPVDGFVVNGLFPERIEAVLDGKDAVCTRIKGGFS